MFVVYVSVSDSSVTFSENEVDLPQPSIMNTLALTEPVLRHYGHYAPLSANKRL